MCQVFASYVSQFLYTVYSYWGKRSDAIRAWKSLLLRILLLQGIKVPPRRVSTDPLFQKMSRQNRPTQNWLFANHASSLAFYVSLFDSDPQSCSPWSSPIVNYKSISFSTCSVLSSFEYLNKYNSLRENCIGSVGTVSRNNWGSFLGRIRWYP